MSITLTREQQAWLEQQVADGALPSVEDGVRSAVADLMAIAQDDLAWAKPYVDEARQSIARGNVVSGEDFLAHLRTQTARLKTV